MNLEIHEINSMIVDCVQIGYMEAVRAYEPANDLIREKELKRWLKIACIPLERFQALERTELVKPFRKGVGKNSPLYYSKKEIKQAFVIGNIRCFIAREY